MNLYVNKFKFATGHIAIDINENKLMKSESTKFIEEGSIFKVECMTEFGIILDHKGMFMQISPELLRAGFTYTEMGL